MNFFRLSNERIHINLLPPPPPPNQPQQPQSMPHKEISYLADLQSIDPYDFPTNGCLCTVTIARLIADAPWWFPSCTRCGKACTAEGNTFRCYQCDCSNYKYKYKLSFIATDGTAEAEMICFGPVAQRIVGRSVDSMMRTVRRDEDFPPDIAGIVSHKFTFAINMTSQSFYTRIKKYMVTSIITSYGRQRAIPRLPAPAPAAQPSEQRRDTTSGTSRTLDKHALSIVSELASQHQTPPASPTTAETPAKEMPIRHVTESTSSQSVKKRLTYSNTTDDEVASHSSQAHVFS